MTYKDLEKVNKEMKLTDIKGKQYAEVPQRIQAFRKLYPEGFIRTELISNIGDMAIIRAEVGFKDVDGTERILGTGLAYEKEGSSFINKTSYIENCETSAVGRALGMLGIGSEESVRSAEEELNAEMQQEAMKPITAVMLKAVRTAIEKNGFKEEKICEYFKLTKLDEMTIIQMRQFNDMVEKSKKEDKKEGK